MQEISAEIDIRTDSWSVWECLVDFDRYPEWNPLMQIQGDPEPDTTVRLKVRFPAGVQFTVSPRITRVVPGRELRWLGRLVLPNLFDGEHSYELYPLPEGGVRFVQREAYTGLFVPILMRIMGKATQRGFEDMNMALKERLESQSGLGLEDE